MKNKLVTAGAVIFSVIGAAALADGNSFSITQIGAQYATAVQSGNGNGGGIAQEGLNGRAEVQQIGDGNYSSSYQAGSNNIATIRQGIAGGEEVGSILANSATVMTSQYGVDGVVGITQTGTGGFIQILQDADVSNNHASVNQDGANTVYVYQSGDDNTADIAQANGDGSYAEVTQTASSSGSWAGIYQYGVNNVAYAYNSGVGNYANIYQPSSNNYASVGQFGSYNSANISQYGGGNTISVSQTGDYGNATVTQYGGETQVVTE